jgi:hypothetical protein
VRAERDGQVRDDVVAVQLAGVDVHAAGRVDRDHGHAVQQPHKPGRLQRQSRPATDADDPVDGDVGPSCGSVNDPPTGRSQRAETVLVGCVGQQDRLDPAAPAGQHRAGVQRVPAVVAPAHEQQHPPAVRRPQQVDHRVGEPRRRPLHQRALGQRRHEF